MIEGIFGGLRFSISVFLGVEKILASIFLGSLISVQIFLGIQNSLKICDSSYVSRSHESVIKFLWL